MVLSMESMRPMLPLLLIGFLQYVNSNTGSEFYCNDVETALQISGYRNGTIITRYKGKAFYQNDQVCEWVIDSGLDTDRIQIQVTASHLQWTLRNSVCSPHDHVEVREGLSKHSDLLSEWCGEEHPVWLTSTGRYLHITFQSNEFNPNQYTGVSLDFTIYSPKQNECPPGWLQPSPPNEYCYKVYRAYESWVRAQTLCGYIQANLVSITSEAEAIFIKDIGGEAFWIGLSDLRHRTKLEWIDREPLTYNRFRDILTDDDPACFVDNKGVWSPPRDCVLGKYAFICKRRKDGTTIYYPPPDTYTGKGSTAGDFVVPLGAGLLAMVLVIVIVAIFVIICCRQRNRCCWKRKQDSQGDVPETRTNARNIAMTRRERNPIPPSVSSNTRRVVPPDTRAEEIATNRGTNERSRRHHHNPSGRHHSGGSGKRHRKRHAQPPPAATGPPPYSPRRPPKPASSQTPAGDVTGGVRPGTPPPPYEP